MDAETKYINALRERFPNVTVLWETPPHKIFETHSCTLIFSPKSNPDVVYRVEFNNGLGNNEVEQDIEALITVHGSQLAEL